MNQSVYTPWRGIFILHYVKDGILRFAASSFPVIPTQISLELPDIQDAAGSFPVICSVLLKISLTKREVTYMETAYDINLDIELLAAYGVSRHLIQPEDHVFIVNQLLDLLGLEDFCPCNLEPDVPLPPLEELLDRITSFAVSRGLTLTNGTTGRDLFDTKLMGVLCPRPSSVIAEFRQKYQKSPQEATSWYYQFSGDVNYIRRDRIAKDVKWTAETSYGLLDITINLSKPEKDPKAIAAALTQSQSSYPKCMLCRENEGFAGRLNHPARQNLRLITLNLGGEPWFMQYSPYVYYREHCIVFNQNHIPMQVSRKSFRRLLDFVHQFPHYFIGSNADLPIVGGSILTHDHFQGGCYTFAMEKAPVIRSVSLPGWQGVEAGIVKWPMSVLRLRSADKERLADAASHILDVWREYSDESAGIFAYTGQTPHNTITPIARMTKDGSRQFEMDLVFRNNRTTEQYPLGIFHPHPEHHHIKKENIGLIEVMGLAVLPARLKKDLEELEAILSSGAKIAEDSPLASHKAWIEDISSRYPVDQLEKKTGEILRREVGLVYANILEQCGVFKATETGLQQFLHFLAAL